jgi:transcription initiation factor IIE alpha subunit
MQTDYCPKCDKMQRPLYEGALCESCGEPVIVLDESKARHQLLKELTQLSQDMGGYG